MQVVLQGRRAKKYVGQGKRKIESWRAAGIASATAAIAVPAGRIIAQRIQSITERVIVKVRDPYIALFIRTRNATTSAVKYTASFGGVTNEPFIPEVPFTQGTAFLNTSVLSYLGAGCVLSLWSNQNVVASEVVTSGAYSITDPATMDVRFCIMDYRDNKMQFLVSTLQVVVNIGAQLLVQVEPIGETDTKIPYSMAQMTVLSSPGTKLYLILAFSNPRKFTEPVLAWPPSDINGGHPELTQITSLLATAGRGVCLFLLSYINDWRLTGNTDTTAVYLIRLVNFGASYQQIPLTDIDAGIGLDVSPACDFAYSGGGHVSMLIVKTSEYRLYASADSGVSWAPVAWPAGAGEVVFTGYDRHGLYSMYKGHVEFVTTDGTTGRRYLSTDYGITWTSSIVGVGDILLRDRAVAVATTFDPITKIPRYYMTAGVVDNTSPTPDYVRIIRFSGVSPTTKLSDIIVAKGVDYESHVGDEYVQQSPGVYAKSPFLCFYGSAEFPAPLLPGHPGELEYTP